MPTRGERVEAGEYPKFYSVLQSYVESAKKNRSTRYEGELLPTTSRNLDRLNQLTFTEWASGVYVASLIPASADSMVVNLSIIGVGAPLDEEGQPDTRYKRMLDRTLELAIGISGEQIVTFGKVVPRNYQSGTYNTVKEALKETPYSRRYPHQGMQIDLPTLLQQIKSIPMEIYEASP